MEGADAMKSNSRRGISSILGASIMIMLTASALATTAAVMQQQQISSNELVRETNRYLDAMNEKIEISKVTIANDKLNITLSNDGGSAARVKSIYIVNETASPKEQYRYDIDHLVDGREVVTNVGQELNFVAHNTKVIFNQDCDRVWQFCLLSLFTIYFSSSSPLAFHHPANGYHR
jgi:flagellin-like protein